MSAEEIINSWKADDDEEREEREEHEETTEIAPANPAGEELSDEELEDVEGGGAVEFSGTVCSCQKFSC